MPITFIEYNYNKEFYIHESFMQLVFYYLYTELQKPQYNMIRDSTNYRMDINYQY